MARRPVAPLVTAFDPGCALLVPPEDAGEGVAGLVHAGLVARRRRALSRALLDAQPVEPTSSASAVEALLAERADGR